MSLTLRGSLLALVQLLLVNCVTIVGDASRSEPEPRLVRAADYPITLVEEAVPSRPHKVIGSVRARVKLSEALEHVAPRSKVIAELKRQARVLGGDALLPITVTPVTGGGTYLSPNGTVLAGNSELWSALVIVWLGP